jgi:predicted DNA-binding transcriptional regulator AlpA
MPEDRLLTSKEAASLLGMAVGTLTNLRWRGEGPPYIKKGRFVRYWLSDLLAWANRDKVIPGEKKEKDRP